MGKSKFDCKIKSTRIYHEIMEIYSEKFQRIVAEEAYELHHNIHILGFDGLNFQEDLSNKTTKRRPQTLTKNNQYWMPHPVFNGDH